MPRRPPGRKRFEQYLTPEAVEGWQHAADRHNLTLTALVEVCGLVFGEDPGNVPEEIVTRTRQLDRERRSRR